jgi:ribosomal protein S27AE
MHILIELSTIKPGKVLIMDTIICPKCGAENLADQMNCQKCGLNLKYGQEHPEEFGDLNQQAYQDRQSLAEDLGCPVNLLRWVGRLWGLGLIVFLPILLLLNYSSMPKKEAPYQLVAFALIVLGMIVAWGLEMVGGLISLAGLVGFYLAIAIFEMENLQTWTCAIVFVLPPIVFFLASSYLRRQNTEK